MSETDLETARGDLAFMRSLVSGGEKQFQAGAGELFLWGGVLYGLQCLGHWLDIIGVIELPPPGMLALGFGPTVIFLIILGVVIWKDRKTPEIGGSNRALSAMFQGAGLANLVTAFVFAYGAHKAQSMTVWLYHPIIVCLFQGVAWFAVWKIRRRAWLGVVAFGWFAVTIVCGVFVDRPAAFLLTLGLGLLAFLALPGWIMLRQARKTG